MVRVSTPAARTDQRPLYTAGGLAAAWAAGIGLAVLLTFTLIGWVAAPHDAFGQEIADVARTAVQAWLVGHLVGFGIPGGEVMMLPLGLVVLPGLLLYRAGRWLARTGDLPRLRHTFRAALALAGPYAAISGTLALIAQTEVIRPSVPQALVAGFVLAFLAGGLGVLRQQLIDKRIPLRRLLELMPDRSRSLLAGTAGATGVLLLSGAVLFFSGLVAGFGEAAAVTRELAPGAVGGTLLFIVQLLYLPNALVFGLAFAVGPGFAVGAGTMVAPTGVAVGAVPMLPMLAALPDNGPAPLPALAALAAPFAAGAVGGVLTQRSAPTVVSEAAPLWGFVCGVATGLVCAALSLLAGGPIGAHRLADVGPSAWQVGLITALEVGVSAAIAAWLANWRHFRRTAAERPADQEEAPEERPAGDDEAGGDPADEDSEEFFGITYEAEPER
ncbi:DUF6350 family protein [Nocardiopsis composta]|uniref:cell division protein PerM n=1 Tax=Nocardiopsis composta TaxID=157465 RepID=UPI001607357D|nr:DUF6350 family protein [Nocardiopsis composta]HLU97314.1 DUF6350 family protein [Thermobifida alba]